MTISKPFNQAGGDCKEQALLYVFKNINDENLKNIKIPTTIHDTFRIEKADINKDGTIDHMVLDKDTTIHGVFVIDNN